MKRLNTFLLSFLISLGLSTPYLASAKDYGLLEVKSAEKKDAKKKKADEKKKKQESKKDSKKK